MIGPDEILFLGLGTSSPLYYRCLLPATRIGADWSGVRGQPPAVQVMTGLVKGETRLPIYDDYRVVILQQPFGTKWLKQINALRSRGIKVLYEIDDYLHGVAKQPGHDFAFHFTKQRVKLYEMCMRACDGLICSTEYLARRYAKFNRSVHVCRNGIDTARYELTRPERSTTNVIWAGATGHAAAVIPWLNELLPIMREREDVCFVSVGQPGLAEAVEGAVGRRGCAIGIPFAPLECYPSAMCCGDIAIAPATDASWFRGKSDLRWLEASALGMPTIGDSRVYYDIEPEVTGFWADDAPAFGAVLRDLLERPERCAEVGAAAREHVISERSIESMAPAWLEVCTAVAGEYESMNQLARTGGRA